jgi:hypothetical protein
MMTTIEHVRRSAQPAPPVLTARQLYLLLKESNERQQALSFLERSLADVAALSSGMPADAGDWREWLEQRGRDNEAAQQRYKDARSAGAPRRHFASRPEARRFLSHAAPALLSEGAWLYGLLHHWDLEALQPLVRVYLEYVGKGIPDWNRVLRARQLLTMQGCVQWQEQEEEHFVQGALRLALSCCGDVMLPELLGYQLGVSAQPLYRPSVSDELRELGIACYLLTPPITADEAAIDCLEQLLPLMQDQADFLRRVEMGYRLHRLGAEPVSAARDPDADPAAAGATPVPAALLEPEGPMPDESAVRQHEHVPRAVIRHTFPEDEHAWEAIDNELGLLEAQVAASETQEEAMALLADRLAPSQHHQPLGLMAGRLFTQLYA